MCINLLQKVHTLVEQSIVDYRYWPEVKLAFKLDQKLSKDDSVGEAPAFLDCACDESLLK